MVTLGIDPGYAIIGYGAVQSLNGKFKSIGYGAITTSAESAFSMRLKIIYENMILMLEKCNPDAISIEKLYFQNNQKTAIYVAQARGVILLAAQESGIPIFEYTPLQVKIAVTGYGKAKKPQIMEMTQKLLNLSEIPKPDDAADALAIALCHANIAKSQMKMKLLKGDQ